ncbi:reverse transcriptase domain-containing protein [Artemisia annua]|uniref:Reverse transcriptase domain-containing protein n=1 Tax=Artemisia annua TaxID=35608 RepID=A0A2U1NQU2_ARTAN|nr:reverse transcriptase domain-containing protein [Artemisia annua]
MEKNTVCFVFVCMLLTIFTNKVVVKGEEVCQSIGAHIKSYVYDFYPRACTGVKCVKTCYNHRPKGELVALAICRATSCICSYGIKLAVHMEDAALFFDKGLRESIENIVVCGGPFFGDLQWRLSSLPIRLGGLGLYSAKVVSSYAFVASRAQSLCSYNTMHKDDIGEWIQPQQLEIYAAYIDFSMNIIRLYILSVRKQHNAGYKHKVKDHLGQTVAFQQVGAAYNQMRPRGQRIKTRNGTLQPPLDPATYADAVVQVYLDNAGDLELIVANTEELNETPREFKEEVKGKSIDSEYMTPTSPERLQDDTWMQEALRALWKGSFPEEELHGLITEQWKEMGWQGKDPSIDFL